VNFSIVRYPSSCRLHFTFSSCPGGLIVVTFTDPTSAKEVTMSCSEMAYSSYVERSIADETCAILEQDTPQAHCCKMVPQGAAGGGGAAEELIRCSICGDRGIIFPEASFTRVEVGDTVSCFDMGQRGEEGEWNEEECEYYTSLAGPCCGGSIVNTPMVSPTTNEKSPNSGVFGSVPSSLITGGMLITGVSFLWTLN